MLGTSCPICRWESAPEETFARSQMVAMSSNFVDIMFSYDFMTFYRFHRIVMDFMDLLAGRLLAGNGEDEEENVTEF